MTCAVVLFAVLLSSAAFASEGNLQIFPDLPFHGLAEAIGAPFGFRLVWLMLLFTLLIFPVNRVVLKPLFRVLDEREERISGTRARARKLEADAEAVLQRYQRSVRETREEAERDRRGLLEAVRAESQRATVAARGEAEHLITQARSEIVASLEDARTRLRAEAQELARQAASQVLGRAL